MKTVRVLLLGFFVFGTVLQTPLPASADPVSTITLPAGSWDVVVTVTSKDAGNTLEFGMSSPEEFTVCPTGEATDCAPGDTHTFDSLSGELTFYLADHSCVFEEIGPATFFSDDSESASIDQSDEHHWTIGWDDAGTCESRDGDFNDLVVSVTATGADLSLAKSDAAPLGPDPVTSGGNVAYLVSVSNAGPDAATEVSVFDAPEGGTIFSAAGTEPESNWSCEVDGEGNNVTCSLAGSLGSGETAEDLVVQVQAPTTATDTSITDTATVSANESDPDTEDNSASQETTVMGSSNASTKDHAQTFYDGTQQVTLQTTRDPGNGFFSKVVIPPGLQPGVVRIDEYPANQTPPGYTFNPATYCGGSPCEFQFQVTVLPEGTTTANNPIQVFWFYTRGIGGNQLYVTGDGETTSSLIKPCKTAGIANPPKCRSSVIRLPNKDRQYLMLWRDGSDPVGAKRG